MSPNRFNVYHSRISSSSYYRVSCGPNGKIILDGRVCCNLSSHPRNYYRNDLRSVLVDCVQLADIPLGERPLYFRLEYMYWF